MTTPTFVAIQDLLTTQFQVDAAQVAPDTPLGALGLDSLSLMEFVFAIEDRFNVRIPEEKLDPRQAGLTLADLASALDGAVAAKGTAPPAEPAAAATAGTATADDAAADRAAPR